MNVVIVGLGSIAQKHIKALRLLDSDVNIFSLRSNPHSDKVEGIINIFHLSGIPAKVDFFIVSNPTSLHLTTLNKLLEFNAPIFLEKPPLLNLDEADQMVSRIKEVGLLVYSAFNMRFHPLIVWAKQYIIGKHVLEVNAYCGSYLPDWRMGVDYRKVYSAREELGGGVHLDLIHELDYLVYLFGQPAKVNHKFGKVSDLEINSIDSAYYWLDYPGFIATISLNYFRRSPKRTLEILLKDDIIEIDLINWTAINAKAEVLFQEAPDMQRTYNEQMEFFLNALRTNDLAMNDFESSIQTLKICLHEF